MPFWPLALLLGATLLVFGQTVTFEFTGWDDDVHLTANPRFQPPRLANIPSYWTAPYFGLYVPVTYTVWTLLGLVARTETPDLAGNYLNPYVFHAANVALHLVNVTLVWGILRRLVRNDLAACAGALVFAVHPLQVEAVAWIAAFRDLLAGTFALLAATIHLDAGNERGDDDKPRRDNMLDGVARHALVTVLYLLAVFSKPTVVILPLVLLLIDWLLLRRRWSWLVAALAPMFLLAPVPVLIARILQPAAGVESVAPWQRLLIAGDALSFYLYKLLVPLGLCIDHGRTPALVLGNPLVYVLALLPLVIAGVLIALRRRYPFVFTGAVIFVAAVLPVLGLVPFNQSKTTVSNRYVYISLFGIGLAIAGGLRLARPRTTGVVMSVLGAALVPISLLQVRTWIDSRRLFEHAVAVNPRSWTAYNNLAAMDLDAGQLDSAEAHARRSIRLQPGFATAHQTLGQILARQGRFEEAIDGLTQAADRWPKDSDLLLTLAAAQLDAGRLPDAARTYERILRQYPNLTIAREYYSKIQARLSTRPTTAAPTPRQSGPPQGRERS